MLINAMPVGASLERYLRQQGFRFTREELYLAIASAQRLNSPFVFLPKGQKFSFKKV